MKDCWWAGIIVSSEPDEYQSKLTWIYRKVLDLSIINSEKLNHEYLVYFRILIQFYKSFEKVTYVIKILEK